MAEVVRLPGELIPGHAIEELAGRLTQRGKDGETGRRCDGVSRGGPDSPRPPVSLSPRLRSSLSPVPCHLSPYHAPAGAGSATGRSR
jgi:hypothetical protein